MALPELDHSAHGPLSDPTVPVETQDSAIISPSFGAADTAVWPEDAPSDHQRSADLVAGPSRQRLRAPVPSPGGEIRLWGPSPVAVGGAAPVMDHAKDPPHDP